MFKTELKSFLKNNAFILLIACFFIVLAYGYFVTTWSISIDSEVFSFNSGGITDIQDGRFGAHFFRFLTDYKMLPFWSDFLMVSFVLFSSLVWSIILERHYPNDKLALFVFLLFYNISPIYAFLFRFTFMTAVGFGMILISLVIYCFNKIITQEKKIKWYLIGTLLLFWAIAIYQVFVFYYITSVLFFGLVLLTSKSHKFFQKNIFKYLFESVFILILSSMSYKIVCFLIESLWIEPRDFVDNYVLWGKRPMFQVIEGFFIFFKDMLFKSYNFYFLIVCVYCFFLLCLYLRKRMDFIFLRFLLILGLLLSPFLLSVFLGQFMPNRTFINLPLVVAAISFLLLVTINDDRIKQLLVLIAFASTFFHCKYINQLFYGDNMRLQYDIHFADRIYSKVQDKVGSNLLKKPLLIYGNSLPKERSYIIKEETIGISFFEKYLGNTHRIWMFMRWLGKDYPFAWNHQYPSSLEQAKIMPSFPDEGSVIETDEYILFKLSDFE